MEKYDNKTTPVIDLEEVKGDKIETMLLIGTTDSIVDKNDVDFAAGQMIATKSQRKEKYKQIIGGHLVFLIGKDMSHMDQIMTWIDEC